MRREIRPAVAALTDISKYEFRIPQFDVFSDPFGAVCKNPLGHQRLSPLLSGSTKHKFQSPTRCGTKTLLSKKGKQSGWKNEPNLSKGQTTIYKNWPLIYRPKSCDSLIGSITVNHKPLGHKTQNIIRESQNKNPASKLSRKRGEKDHFANHCRLTGKRISTEEQSSQPPGRWISYGSQTASRRLQTTQLGPQIHYPPAGNPKSLTAATKRWLVGVAVNPNQRASIREKAANAIGLASIDFRSKIADRFVDCAGTERTHAGSGVVNQISAASHSYA